MRNQGFQVDDDNDPVEEHIPGDGSIDLQVEDKPSHKDWGCNGIGPRKVDGCDTNREAKIKSMGSQKSTFTGCFFLFFSRGLYYKCYSTKYKYKYKSRYET